MHIPKAPASSLFSIGNSPMINFNWENDKSPSYLSLDNKKSFPITNYEDIQSKLQNHSLTDSPQHLTSDSFNSTQNQSDDELLDIKYALGPFPRFPSLFQRN